MRWVVKRTWADWEREVVWQSLYFSLAVWMSLVLIHLPDFRKSRPPTRPDRMDPTGGPQPESARSSRSGR